MTCRRAEAERWVEGWHAGWASKEMAPVSDRTYHSGLPANGRFGTTSGLGHRRPAAQGFVRIPKPGPGERYGWNFSRGDRFVFEFDPDSGDCRRFGDRLLFRINDGEISLLGPCDSRSLGTVIVRLPNGQVLPLDALVSDDETIDRLARSLGGAS